MAEEGYDSPASDRTATSNLFHIRNQMRESGRDIPSIDAMRGRSEELRRELRAKGIQGFKRGGRVHRTGIYKLHRGERVIPSRSRRARRR